MSLGNRRARARAFEKAKRSGHPGQAFVRKLTRKIGFQEPDDTLEEYEARAALRAAEKLKYFTAPPTDTPLVKLVVVGPKDNGNVISFSSPVFMDLLNIIRRRRRVWIAADEPGSNSLTIEAVNLADLWAGHRSIKELVHGLNKPQSNRMFMVQPVGDDNIGTTLSIDTSVPGMARLFSAGVQKAALHSLLLNQVTDFRDYFRTILEELATAQDRLHMELRFGKLQFHAKHWEDATGPISVGRLQASLAECGNRNTVHLDSKIPDTDYFQRLRHHVLASEENFYPYASTTSSLSETPRLTTLVLWTDGLRIELEVDRSKSASGGGFAKLSNLRVFQLRRMGGYIEMNVACPTHKFDWKLEALAELDTSDVPPHIEALPNKIAVKYTTGGDEFPVPTIRPELVHDCRIKQVAVKISWTVGCRGTSYALEMAQLQQRTASKSAEKPYVYAALTIRNSSWEDTLKQQPTPGNPRDLGSDLEHLFPPTQPGGGVYDFLYLVQEKMNMMDGIPITGKYEKQFKIMNAAVQKLEPDPNPAHAQTLFDLDSNAAIPNVNHKQDSDLLGLVKTRTTISNQEGSIFLDSNSVGVSEEEDLIIFD